MHEGICAVLSRGAGCRVFAERWTPLILRELLSGARRFADIHRGVPRISRNLLCQRLDALAHSGIIMRKPIHRGEGSNMC